MRSNASWPNKNVTPDVSIVDGVSQDLTKADTDSELDERRARFINF